MDLRFYAFSLRGGVGIGVKGDNNSAGTLGGFLEDEKGKCYILSTQDVLHPPEMNNSTENVIEQPAQIDYDTMLHEAEASLIAWQSRKSAIERRSTLRMGEERFEGLIKGSEENIKDVKCELERIKNEKPREIGKYVCGMRDNFDMRLRGDNDHFFVNAAIAELNKSEVEFMKMDKLSECETNRCPLYGFENTKGFCPNGVIIDLENIVKECTGVSEMPFMKIGRTTGYTSGSLADTSMFRSECLPHASGLTCILFKDVKEVKEGDGGFLAHNCILIRKRRSPFSKRGDAGALVFDSYGRAWGLIVGRFLCGSLAYDLCVASPLTVVLKALEEKSGIKGLKLWQLCIHKSTSIVTVMYHTHFLQQCRSRYVPDVTVLPISSIDQELEQDVLH